MRSNTSHLMPGCWRTLMFNPAGNLIDAIHQKLAECKAENKPQLLHIEFTSNHTLPHQLQRSLGNARLINGDDYALPVGVDEIVPGELPELGSPSSMYILDNVELIENSSLIKNLTRIMNAGGAAIIIGQLDEAITHQLATFISTINTNRSKWNG